MAYDALASCSRKLFVQQGLSFSLQLHSEIDILSKVPSFFQWAVGPCFEILLNISISFNGREAIIKSQFWLEFILLLLCLSVCDYSLYLSYFHWTDGSCISPKSSNMLSYMLGLWEILWNVVPIHLAALSQFWVSWCWLNNWIFSTHVQPDLCHI